MANHPPRLKRYARLNRRAMNNAETRLWYEIRRKLIGHKFRRQHIIGPYIVDFVCLALKLVIEVDGSQHQDSIGDHYRDQYLRSRGFTVVRVWSWDVLRDIDGVLTHIHNAIDEITT